VIYLRELRAWLIVFLLAVLHPLYWRQALNSALLLALEQLSTPQLETQKQILLLFQTQLLLTLITVVNVDYLPILVWAGVSATLFIGTFIFYVAIMKMREIKHEIYALHWSVRWVYYLILFIGLVLDVLLNWIVCTVIFFELPKEFLTTARVVRHKRESSGFRYRLAIYFCHHWLTPFDKSHCE
jgi:hypothetical protein